MSDGDRTALDLAVARDALRERDRRQALLDAAERVRSLAESRRREALGESEARSASSLLGQALGELEEAHDDARRDVWSDSNRHDRRKYEHMERADSLISSADASIAQLRDRLEEAGLAGADGVETEGSGRTWDTWFDNVWSDRRVRDEIDGSASSVRTSQGQVDRLRDELQDRLHALENEVVDLSARRDELLG